MRSMSPFLIPGPLSETYNETKLFFMFVETRIIPPRLEVVDNIASRPFEIKFDTTCSNRIALPYTYGDDGQRFNSTLMLPSLSCSRCSVKDELITLFRLIVTPHTLT